MITDTDVKVFVRVILEYLHQYVDEEDLEAIMTDEQLDRFLEIVDE
jgi:hypothetical protein